MTVTSDAGDITKVVVTCTGSGDNNYAPGKFSGTGYTYSGTVGTWEGSAKTVTLSASAQVRITKIVVTYSQGGSSTQTCATPTFSVESGVYTSARSVSLASTSGATIYYTTDGNNPTTSSSEYKSAITVSETMTIKAIAVKEGYNNSQVARAQPMQSCSMPVRRLTPTP